MKQKWSAIFNRNQKYDQETIINILKKLDFKLSFEIIHVVGTNGKGSVAHILHHNLQKKFSKVGLFTSPHLISPYERIKINHQNIDEQSFWRLYKLIPNNLNFFASFYIIAMLYFLEQKCEIVVLEAGIGGRYDATGTIKGKYGLLTSIDFDHVELLGDSLLQIAAEKYAIKDEKMTFLLPSSLNIDIAKKLASPNTFIIDNTHQDYRQRNFKLAMQFLKKYFEINDVQNISILGRCHTFIHNNCLTIFDVAHNQSGIEATLKFLSNHNYQFQAVVIMMKKTKKTNFLTEIFKNYRVFYYQKNAQFHDFNIRNWTKITDLKKFYFNQQMPTLYLGSFVLIGELYGFKK